MYKQVDLYTAAILAEFLEEHWDEFKAFVNTREFDGNAKNDAAITEIAELHLYTLR